MKKVFQVAAFAVFALVLFTSAIKINERVYVLANENDPTSCYVPEQGIPSESSLGTQKVVLQINEGGTFRPVTQDDILGDKDDILVIQAFMTANSSRIKCDNFWIENQ